MPEVRRPVHRVVVPEQQESRRQRDALLRTVQGQAEARIQQEASRAQDDPPGHGRYPRGAEVRLGTDGQPLRPRWKAERDSAEAHDPSVPAADFPRWSLRRLGFLALAKCTDLREFGYQIVVWARPESVRDGLEYAVAYEYVPRANEDGTIPENLKRKVAFTFEEQRDFHASIGAPAVATQGELFA